MAVMPFPYPVVLTNSNWQKRKGLKAKTTKTGVGEALTALEKAFAKSPFGKLDPDQMGTETPDKAVFEKKVESLRQSLAGAHRNVAKYIAAADKVVGKAVTEFAKQNNQDVRVKLEHISTQLKQFDKDIDTYVSKLVGETNAAHLVMTVKNKKK